MNRLILASAAALAFTVTPLAAQDVVAVDADGDVYVLTDTQQTMYDGWPADRRAVYDAWPMGVQEYYWTLEPTQQTAWWVLTDPQRVRVYEMTPEQRTTAWTQISAQMNAAATTPAATAGASTTMAGSAAAPMASGNMRFVSNAMIQDIPMDQAQGEIPICGPNDFDNCINSWEARKTGTRPLDHWPGQPASSMDDDDE